MLARSLAHSLAVIARLTADKLPAPAAPTAPRHISDNCNCNCNCNCNQAFVCHTRETVAEAVRSDRFEADTIEATCMCKFLGTGFGVDCVSALRKTMGARALQAGAKLGPESFLPNATSAAEGDNTIMELKVLTSLGTRY